MTLTVRMLMTTTPSSPPSIRILAFDPGAGVTGWCVLEYDSKRDKVTLVKHGLIKGEQAAKALKKVMLPEFSRQYTILCAIRDVVTALIQQEKPDYVTSEGPFAHRFIQAYASLKLVVDRIRQAVHQTLNRDLYEIQPTEAKRDLAGKGTAKKEEMKEAIAVRKDIVTTAHTRHSLKIATEHEIDAVGVGYSFIQRHLKPQLQTSTTKKKA